MQLNNTILTLHMNIGIILVNISFDIHLFRLNSRRLIDWFLRVFRPSRAIWTTKNGFYNQICCLSKLTSINIINLVLDDFE